MNCEKQLSIQSKQKDDSDTDLDYENSVIDLIPLREGHTKSYQRFSSTNYEQLYLFERTVDNQKCLISMQPFLKIFEINNQYLIIRWLCQQQQHQSKQISQIIQFNYLSQKIVNSKVQEFTFVIEKGNIFNCSEVVEFSFQKYLKCIDDLISNAYYFEECGVYHNDLRIRNLVIINEKFKIIDFDMAFFFPENRKSNQLIKIIHSEQLNDPMQVLLKKYFQLPEKNMLKEQIRSYLDCLPGQNQLRLQIQESIKQFQNTNSLQIYQYYCLKVQNYAKKYFYKKSLSKFLIQITQKYSQFQLQNNKNKNNLDVQIKWLFSILNEFSDFSNDFTLCKLAQSVKNQLKKNSNQINLRDDDNSLKKTLIRHHENKNELLLLNLQQQFVERNLEMLIDFNFNQSLLKLSIKQSNSILDIKKKILSNLKEKEIIQLIDFRYKNKQLSNQTKISSIFPEERAQFKIKVALNLTIFVDQKQIQSLSPSKQNSQISEEGKQLLNQLTPKTIFQSTKYYYQQILKCKKQNLSLKAEIKELKLKSIQIQKRLLQQNSALINTFKNLQKDPNYIRYKSKYETIPQKIYQFLPAKYLSVEKYNQSKQSNAEEIISYLIQIRDDVMGSTFSLIKQFEELRDQITNSQITLKNLLMKLEEQKSKQKSKPNNILINLSEIESDNGASDIFFQRLLEQKNEEIQHLNTLHAKIIDYLKFLLDRYNLIQNFERVNQQKQEIKK